MNTLNSIPGFHRLHLEATSGTAVSDAIARVAWPARRVYFSGDESSEVRELFSDLRALSLIQGP